MSSGCGRRALKILKRFTVVSGLGGGKGVGERVKQSRLSGEDGVTGGDDELRRRRFWSALAGCEVMMGLGRLNPVMFVDEGNVGGGGELAGKLECEVVLSDVGIEDDGWLDVG